MESVYGGHLSYGPPIEQGFYYDMHSAEYSGNDEDYKVLDDLVKNVVEEKKLEMKKSDFMDMFKYNEFKLRILRAKVTTETTTVYKCGPPDNNLMKEWKQFQEEAA